MLSLVATIIFTFNYKITKEQAKQYTQSLIDRTYNELNGINFLTKELEMKYIFRKT